MNAVRGLLVKKSKLFPLFILFIILTAGDRGPVKAEKECGCGFNKLEKRIANRWKGDRSLSNRLNKLGLAKHRKKDYCGAIGTWCQAAEADPSFWKPFFNIACAHSLTGNPGLALKFIRRSLISNTIFTLDSLISDSDLKPIRNHPGYEKLLKEYGGREGIKALVTLGNSLKKGDYRLFRSLIHRERGIMVQQKKVTYEAFGPEDFQKIKREMYRKGPLNINKERDSLVGNVTTNYKQDPPGSPMRCESWTDNFFELKKTGNSWYLHSVHSEGNGGC